MKLIYAVFTNFRLLRDLELDFSTDSERNLTVVRAENESGKTTILNALQWALYGDDALPGTDSRLSPIDWDASDSKDIPISVQVEFEVKNLRESPRKGAIETIERYCIIRSTLETLNGTGHNRTPSKVKLLQLTDEGSTPIDPPEALVREQLPPELREVFFTDGDRALSFIETTASVKTKRERVKSAIRSLLGLELIENSLKHIGRTTSELNKEAKKIRSDTELTKIATELEEINKAILGLEEKTDDANLQFTEFNQKCVEIDQEIKATLSKGNRDELKHDLEQTKRQLKEIDNKLVEASGAHSQLFENLTLSRDLIALILEKSLGKLDELRDQGKLPTTTIPVLEERLIATTCICGESLDPYKPNDKHRREHIRHLIEESRKADELQKNLTDLYYGSLSLQPKKVTDAEHWVTEYAKIADDRDELKALRREHGENLKALEVKLDAIPDTDIHGLRETEREYIAQRDRFNTARTRYETQLEPLKEKRKSLVAQRNNLDRQQGKSSRILARQEATDDITRVLQNSYDRITNEELNKVSELMSKFFLEMIRADRKQRAIIRKAEISKEYDILVYGPSDRLLHTQHDLNGASRRALTLAFILALTKVSGIEAPNVIDTPLGMLSGAVKKSVLKTTIRESSQLILFLTSSEIAGCGKILDDKAGQVITLTNTAHYPEMLVNAPSVKEFKVLRCECNHKQECQICQRQIDIETEPRAEEVTSDTTIS